MLVNFVLRHWTFAFIIFLLGMPAKADLGGGLIGALFRGDSWSTPATFAGSKQRQFTTSYSTQIIYKNDHFILQELEESGTHTYIPRGSIAKEFADNACFQQAYKSRYDQHAESEKAVKSLLKDLHKKHPHLKGKFQIERVLVFTERSGDLAPSFETQWKAAAHDPQSGESIEGQLSQLESDCQASQADKKQLLQSFESAFAGHEKRRQLAADEKYIRELSDRALAAQEVRTVHNQK